MKSRVSLGSKLIKSFVENQYESVINLQYFIFNPEERVFFEEKTRG